MGRQAIPAHRRACFRREREDIQTKARKPELVVADSSGSRYIVI